MKSEQRQDRSCMQSLSLGEKEIKLEEKSKSIGFRRKWNQSCFRDIQTWMEINRVSETFRHGWMGGDWVGAALTEREQGCHLAEVQILVAGEASDWIFEIETSDPTSDPTSNPTSDPTSNPTSDPTSNPTSNPTSDPTSDPNSQSHISHILYLNWANLSQVGYHLNEADVICLDFVMEYSFTVFCPEIMSWCVGFKH